MWSPFWTCNTHGGRATKEEGMSSGNNTEEIAKKTTEVLVQSQQDTTTNTGRNLDVHLRCLKKIPGRLLEPAVEETVKFKIRRFRDPESSTLEK